VRDIEVRPSVRRGDRFAGGRRGPVGRLTALAVVCAVLLLPQTSSTAQALADPSITPVIGGTLGASGWYRSAVSVVWQIQPAPDPGSIVGCQPTSVTSDTRGTKLSCHVTWNGGTIEDTKSRVIKVDKTAPAVTARASRSPDANGWYNHAVPVAFYGSDPTSGVASCSAANYAGPDNATAVVPGTCTDVAGNAGHASLRLAYDATPPQLKKLRVKLAEHSVTLRWQVSSDTKRVVITRAPGAKPRTIATVYGGTGTSFRDKRLRIGKRYRYTVSAYDVAGNKAGRTIWVTATGALTAPAPGARVKGAPRLSWAPVRGATYYNVQVVRNGTIFSAWPRGTSLKLPRSWIYHGKRYRLHRGVYRWYVWPGFGTRSANKYGRMVGRSSFFFAG
jgi:hypothetical protein